MTKRPRTVWCGEGALVVFFLFLAASASAHRLDEYLQAARLSLARERVGVELDLTPGVACAPAIISIIDRDADSSISPQEAREYGLSVLSQAAVTLDGRAVGLTLDRMEIPPTGDLRAGIGTIELRASGRVERLAAGRHELRFRNDHHPDSASYLINALVPDTSAIRVVTQRRDATQREGRIEYDVAPASSLRWLWLIAVVGFRKHIAAGLRRLRNSP